MSQYPSPYLPPQYPVDLSYYPQVGDLLAPARRAGVVLFILGAVGMACGLCVGTAVWAVPSEQLEQVVTQSGLKIPDMTEMGLSLTRFLRIVYSVVGALSLVAGIALIVLGLFVRRGGKASAITAIVLTSLILLWLGTQAVGVAGILAQGNLAGGSASLCFLALPGVLLVLALTWLVQAARNAPQVAQQQRQFQAQYMQMQQQQMGYGQGGYGYGVPGPPPPAPSPPAIAPPASPPRAGPEDGGVPPQQG